MPAARPIAEFRAVWKLVDQGATSREIAAQTGIPYDTVRRWRQRTSPPQGADRPASDDWQPQDPTAYSYLLGLYLGDGYIQIPPRGSPRLVITLDARYEGIIDEASAAIRRTMPRTNICRYRGPGAVIVAASHPAWSIAFPQHGIGRKHLRKIELVPWQRSITHADPRPLLRGLLHSDGARCVNRFGVPLPSGRVARYAYSRYFFTNYSTDIQRIFCDHCELLGIRWTQSSFKNISISRRDSVALLDAFVGPKR